MEDRRLQKAAPREVTHNVIMENRKKMSISGVQDVESFDEQNIILYTEMGLLTIRGDDLHINKLSVESGEVIVEGSIDSCVYSDADMTRKSGGFLRRMFQ